MDYRENNFDFLRLLLASFVIITHSYPLSGVKECDFICQNTDHQISFSTFAIKGFFVLSGYLIFQSLQRSRSISDYYWKRFLRFYPALIVVLFLTVLLTPFIYESNIPLLNNRSFYTYLPKNLSIYRYQPAIKGVFENNPYNLSINGSLWTIPYEVTLYILLSFFFVLRKNKTTAQILLIVLFFLLFFSIIVYPENLKQYNYSLNAYHLFDLSIFFIAGTLLATFNIEKINRKKLVLFMVSIVAIGSLYFGLFNYFKYFTVPFIVILFGLIPIPLFYNIVNRLGDLSYGVYIYAFPVQQTLVHYFKLNYLELMLPSLVITFVFAYFSWHLIEKNALKLKSKTYQDLIKNKLLMQFKKNS